MAERDPPRPGCVWTQPPSARIREHLGEDFSRVRALLDILVEAYGEGASLTSDDVGPTSAMRGR